MSKPEIIEESALSMFELKEILQKNQKQKELNFRANKTLEYLQEFVHMKKDVYQEFKDKLHKLNIPRLKDEHIVKIIDVVPRSAEEVKSLLSGYTVSVSNENLKKIVDVVNSCVK